MCDTDIEIARNALKQNVVHLFDYDEADGLMFYACVNKYIIFDNISVKNYFINNVNRHVINCNSSYSKFLKEMEYFNSLSIFNNVNFCTDIRILKMIANTNNLIIE